MFGWLAMRFGLSNAPTTFMCFMNDAMCPFINSIDIVCLDDILVFGYTWKEGVVHLKQGIKTLGNING